MNAAANFEEVEAFVYPDYADKDIMHNLAHIRRLQALAQEIAKSYDHDPQLLVLSAYFHGSIDLREVEIKQFLESNQFSEQEINNVIQVAWESRKDSTPETIEGKILHDAHLLEGGKTFMITKSLVTGTARGQSLEETIQYLEEKIIGQFKCCLPELQKLYAEKEEYAKAFLKDLKSNL